MLPKTRRLPRIVLQRVLQSGQKLVFPSFTLLHLPNNLGFPRFGLITSSRLSKSAVVRNTLRRLIYSHLSSYTLSRDILIIPHSKLLKSTPEEIDRYFMSAITGLSQVK